MRRWSGPSRSSPSAPRRWSGPWRSSPSAPRRWSGPSRSSPSARTRRRADVRIAAQLVLVASDGSHAARRSDRASIARSVLGVGAGLGGGQYPPLVSDHRRRAGRHRRRARGAGILEHLTDETRASIPSYGCRGRRQQPAGRGRRLDGGRPWTRRRPGAARELLRGLGRLHGQPDRAGQPVPSAAGRRLHRGFCWGPAGLPPFGTIPRHEEARPSRDGPPPLAATEGYLCFLAGVKLLARAMTADGSVVMQMA